MVSLWVVCSNCHVVVLTTSGWLFSRPESISLRPIRARALVDWLMQAEHAREIRENHETPREQLFSQPQPLSQP
jgi:hypothetical protein